MKLLNTLLLVTILTGCGNTPTIVTGFEGKPLPAFNVLQMDSSTHLNMANIPNGKPVVIFLFSPYCPYCRAQTEDIVKNIKKLQNVRVYMLSQFPFGTLKDYCNQYKLSDYPNLTVVQDYGNFFGDYYKAPGVPFTAIYSKDKVLKEVMIGKTTAGDIRKATLN